MAIMGLFVLVKGICQGRVNEGFYRLRTSFLKLVMELW
jgi:hypothetical protein